LLAVECAAPPPAIGMAVEQEYVGIHGTDPLSIGRYSPPMARSLPLS
jgi:hypothetical protein